MLRAAREQLRQGDEANAQLRARARLLEQDAAQQRARAEADMSQLRARLAASDEGLSRSRASSEEPRYEDVNSAQKKVVYLRARRTL